MSLRAKFFTILFVVIVFIGFVVYALLRTFAEPATNVNAGESAAPAAPAAPAIAVVAQNPATGSAAEKKTVNGADDATLAALARSFVERYGTFSNASDFANLTELRAQMTATFRAATDAVIAEARVRATPNAAYSATTTFVIAVGALSGTDTARTVVVKTRRQETGADRASRTLYQDAVVSMIKEGGTWKVESVTWK